MPEVGGLAQLGGEAGVGVEVAVDRGYVAEGEVVVEPQDVRADLELAVAELSCQPDHLGVHLDPVAGRLRGDVDEVGPAERVGKGALVAEPPGHRDRLLVEVGRAALRVDPVVVLGEPGEQDRPWRAVAGTHRFERRLQCLGHLLVEAADLGGERDPDRGPGHQLRIADRGRFLDRGLQRLPRLGEVPSPHPGFAEQEQQPAAAAGVDAGDLPGFQRPAVVVRGLLVAELAAGLIAGPLGVVDRLLRVAGTGSLVEVVGQLRQAAVGPPRLLRVDLLQGGRDAAVQGGSLGGAQLFVEGLPDQGMGEAVAAVAAAGLEELGSDRLLEGTVKLGAVDVRDPGQGLFVEVPPDRRGAAQDLVGLLG